MVHPLKKAMMGKSHWDPIGQGPHHGIALPLFSLRSKKSSGIGEFLDLIPLINWCHQIGYDTIQLLPLYDTGNDRSPYNTISSTALDPVYLSLWELNEGPLPAGFELLSPLPKLPRFEVKQAKLRFLFTLFEKRFENLKKEESYQRFVEKTPWLLPYALFKAIKDEYGGKRWSDWPKELQTFSFDAIPSRQKGVDFHCFLQFHCFRQMEQVKAHATAHKVFLKGDMPLFVSFDSVDVWQNRSLFSYEAIAGVPPDIYNWLGQKWGFPLLHWEEMEKTGFQWWKQRLQSLLPLFHIYRIDHVLGLFRVWAIGKEKKPTEGRYLPTDSTLWAKEGKQRLQMFLDSSPLLPIAEDLGTVPPEVPPILQELGICSTKVIRWEYSHESADKHYIPYVDYPCFSLTTVSTHDTDTLSVWWRKFPQEAIRFCALKKWIYKPQITKEQLFSILLDSHQTPSLFHINLLQEYLALIPDMTAANPEEERINIPGTQLPTNWTYRFRPSIEEMQDSEPLTSLMKQLLEKFS